MGEWIKCSERMPKTSGPVLAFYVNRCGKGRRVRAKYVPFRQVEAGCETEEICTDYDEEKDIYYLSEGWYELIDNWDDYSSIVITEGNVTHWMPLPEPPSLV